MSAFWINPGLGLPPGARGRSFNRLARRERRRVPPLTAHHLVASFRSLVLAAWGDAPPDDPGAPMGVSRRDHPALAVVLGLLLDMRGYRHCETGGDVCLRINDGEFIYAMSPSTIFRVPRPVPPGPDPVDDGGTPDDGHGSRDPTPS